MWLTFVQVALDERVTIELAPDGRAKDAGAQEGHVPG